MGKMKIVFEALNLIVFNCNYYGNLDVHEETVVSCLKALKIIIKKANISLYHLNCSDRYYFKTTNNLYEISKDKYDLLKDVL